MTVKIENEEEEKKENEEEKQEIIHQRCETHHSVTQSCNPAPFPVCHQPV